MVIKYLRTWFYETLKFQWRHGVDGGLFEGIDGAGVFLGVGEAAVSADAGHCLDEVVIPGAGSWCFGHLLRCHAASLWR